MVIFVYWMLGQIFSNQDCVRSYHFYKPIMPKYNARNYIIVLDNTTIPS
jgi:hypothetical protein